jgi:PiT family inorganic phosphate transporter
MLTHLDPASALAVGLLIFALLMVVIFEATNGFHDAANAVATVIYTRSLRPTQAVVWSGVMNFVGVLVGGIAVAYALVELLPAEVLSPPDGGPAVAMLIALFVAARSRAATLQHRLTRASRARPTPRPGDRPWDCITCSRIRGSDS